MAGSDDERSPEPVVRIVCSNTEADLAQRRAVRRRRSTEAEVGFALRRLAANLLRIIRGAGQPSDVVDQLTAVLKAIEAHRAAGGLLSEDCVAPMLRLDYPERHGLDAERRAESFIVHAALQVAASRLMDQSFQERAGQIEMRQGVDEIGVLRRRKGSV
jgi:hypothetical protein